MSGEVILVNESLCGFPYGMQRDFEAEISQKTGAVRVPIPDTGLHPLVRRFTNPATRYRVLTDCVPKRPLENLSAETLWVILMGPEENPLWYFKTWGKSVSKSILYLFDTFEAQVPLIQKMLKSTRWDYTITSFPAAVPMLEAATSRQWHAVMQGVREERFFPLSDDEKPSVGFSSYGRRWPALHEAIKQFCRKLDIHYDYTVASDLVRGSDPCDNYQILAWHLRQSWFTVCWPVELTNPKRVLSFSPITCRWFEAAASGCVVIGKPPSDPKFSEVFGEHFVEPIDPYGSVPELTKRLEELWEQRFELRRRRLALWQARRSQWTWSARVQEMRDLTSATST